MWNLTWLFCVINQDFKLQAKGLVTKKVVYKTVSGS